jgi:hypothetical protein
MSWSDKAFSDHYPSGYLQPLQPLAIVNMAEKPILSSGCSPWEIRFLPLAPDRELQEN